MSLRKLFRRLKDDPVKRNDEAERRKLAERRILTKLAKLEGKLEKISTKLKRPLPIWEDMVSAHSFDRDPLSALESAERYLPDSPDSWQAMWSDAEHRPDLSLDEIAKAAARDRHPLPPTADREGYYGDRHFKYWASGLREMRLLESYAAKHGVAIDAYLDFGCATGRVLRHFASQRETERVCGVDINRRHIEWMCKYLPMNVEAAQTTSIPTLPFPDDTFDLVTAFSVFTHIEAFETAWLLELKRILKPGGLAWITIHSENTWADLQPGWPLHDLLAEHRDFLPYRDRRDELPQDRLVFRRRVARSYSSDVFYRTDYVRRVWGRIFEVIDILKQASDFQDVALMRKR